MYKHTPCVLAFLIMILALFVIASLDIVYHFASFVFTPFIQSYLVIEQLPSATSRQDFIIFNWTFSCILNSLKILLQEKIKIRELGNCYFHSLSNDLFVLVGEVYHLCITWITMNYLHKDTTIWTSFLFNNTKNFLEYLM